MIDMALITKAQLNREVARLIVRGEPTNEQVKEATRVLRLAKKHGEIGVGGTKLGFVAIAHNNGDYKVKKGCVDADEDVYVVFGKPAVVKPTLALLFGAGDK